jgi:hypothetical protein
VHNFIEIINVNQVTLISFCIRIKENLLSVSLYSSVSLVGSIEKKNVGTDLSGGMNKRKLRSLFYGGHIFFIFFA